MKKIKHYCLILVALLLAVPFWADAAISVGDTISSGGILYKVTGANQITNPSFEDGLTGWLAGDGTALNAANFAAIKDGKGAGDSTYVKALKDGGSTSPNSIRTMWPTGLDTLYLFSFYASYKDSLRTDNMEGYTKVSGTNAIADETLVLMASAKFGGGKTWAFNSVAFKAKHNNVKAHFRWLASKFCYDNFSLNKVDSIGLDLSALRTAIASATTFEAKNWANVATLSAAIDSAETILATAITPTQVTNTIAYLNTAVNAYKLTGTYKTADGPNDFTFVLANPSFETGNTNGWTTNTGSSDIGSKSINNPTYTMFPSNGAYLFNVWGGTNLPYFVEQKLTNLPRGFYSLTAVAASDSGNVITLYAGENTADIVRNIKPIGTGIYDTVPWILVTDGKLTIGARSQKWFKVDDFRLKYVPTLDYTSSIVNPTIEGATNNDVPNGWTINKGTGNSYTNTGQHYLGSTSNRYMDSWAGSGMIYVATQKVTGIPNGLYNVSAAARSTGTGSYVTGGNKQTEIIANGDAGGALGRGWNLITVNEVSVEDSTITIGVKTTPGWTGSWFSCDDFRLEFLGKPDVALFKPILDTLIAQAKRFDQSTSPNGLDALLNTAITSAEAAVDLAAIKANIDSLTIALNNNIASVKEYGAFKAKINEAELLYTTTSFGGLEALNTAINAAKVVYNGAGTMPADIAPADSALNKALYNYKVTQPAPADFTFVLANPSFEGASVGGVDSTSVIPGAGSYAHPEGWKVYLNLKGTGWVNSVLISANVADGAKGFETWSATSNINEFNVSQKIVAPANGYYLMTAKARTNEPLADAHLFAKVDTLASVVSSNLAQQPGLITGAGWDSKEAWRTLSLGFKANAGDTVQLGIQSASFMQIDNFTLAFKGNNNPSTIDIGYITKAKAMDAAADSVANDPVYRMLKNDPKLNVQLKVLTDVANTAVLDLAPYDVLVIQESMGGGDGILFPAGALALAKLPVPTLYNKTYAFKAGRALASGAAGTGAEATAGVYTLKVDSANLANTLFNAIPMVNGEFRLFKAGATDLGAAGTKALNVATGVTGTEGTLLAYPSGMAPVICINDMPAGDTIGGQILKSRIITFGMNFGALSYKFGDNMTDANYTLWRNAIYKLAGLEVPTTPVLVPRKSASVGYFAFKKAMNAATADTVGNDPIYRMLKADTKLNVTMNTLTDVSDTAKVDMGAYDVVIVQESFGGGDKILTPAGALGLSKFKVPTLYNKNYAFKNGRALADGSAATGAELAGVYTLTIDSTQLNNPLFKAMPLVGRNARMFMVGATDLGELTGTKALNYATGVSGTTGTLLAAPTGATNPTISVNDIPAGSVIGGQTINARMITLGVNYGALCRENGGNITDANYTLWRNAVYSLGRIEIPNTPVTMPKGPKLTAQVGYFTLKKAMDVTADSVEVDPIYRMLKTDTKLNVTMNVLTTSTAATQVDLTPYDVIVIQESLGGGDGILTPNGNLALAKLSVPAVYNKSYAFKTGRAITVNDTTGTAAGTEAPVGTWTMTVDTANQHNALFNGITFTDNKVQLFTGHSNDLGAIGTTTNKALNYAANVPGVQGTLLGYPTGVTTARIAFNDIPAGTTVGGQLTKSRIITMGQNFGAMCAQHGLYVTNDNHTLWRNAIYSLGRIAIPTTGVVFNAVKPVSVEAASVEVYPNPTADMLNIRGIDPQSIVKVYSVTGQMVFAGQANSETTTVDFSKFNKGLYLLKVETNGKTVTTKVVKK